MPTSQSILSATMSSKNKNKSSTAAESNDNINSSGGSMSGNNSCEGEGGGGSERSPLLSRTASSVSSSGTAVTALPSAEALHQLLSPDGYYAYLQIPKPPSATASSSSFASSKETTTTRTKSKQNGGECDGIDVDLIRRNYRRLSLKHHPDRKNGDAETFKVLTRAKHVLLHEKLRKQYDLVGLDLEDDEVEQDHYRDDDDYAGEGGEEDGGGGGEDGNDKRKKQKGNGDGGEKGKNEGSADTVVSHMAQATLVTILKAAVRTAMMAAVSTFLCRFKFTVIPCVLFMIVITYRVYGVSRQAPGSISLMEMAAPLLISFGMILMYYGRGDDYVWSWTFWFGETVVMTMFTYNSVPVKTPSTLIGFSVLSLLLSLIIRGKFWRYAAIIAFEGILAFIAVLIFPIMEMILEEIINEKLRKVGEKVRANAKRVEAYASHEKR